VVNKPSELVVTVCSSLNTTAAACRSPNLMPIVLFVTGLPDPSLAMPW
jgi:hypothetical protein